MLLVYNGGIGNLPLPGGGALPVVPALPVSYSSAQGNTLGGNHPHIQPDATEIFNAIQTTPNVTAVIIHIKNILRMCSNCASLWQHFTQLYFVAAGNGVEGIGAVDKFALFSSLDQEMVAPSKFTNNQ